jgi:hypothetical protein
METIQIKTLVDITKPPVSRPGQGSFLEQNQYKNWITLQQCIGLRSIIEFDEQPKSEIVDIKGLGFGNRYKGQHRVWTFEFRPDRTMSYDNEKGNPIGLLFDDVNNVPIIEKLNETINIKQAVFDLESPQYKNTIITASFGQTT